MNEDTQRRRRDRRNAFERAEEATLALDVGWWSSLAGAELSEVEFSEPEFIRLGEEAVVGGMILDRRIVTYRVGDEEPQTATITRPVTTRFSALPIELLERIARDILEKSEQEHREANIEAVVAAARSLDEDERLRIARDVLGVAATNEEVEDLADQLKMADALVEGGEAAAAYFDANISPVRITGEEGEEVIADDPPEPRRTALLTGEWDYYTPEDVEHFGGPESDAAYAFRIVSLCEAMRAEPDAATQLAMHVGAITREWEMWRENEEFLRAGRKHFAQQSHLASSRTERPWMRQVRQDLEAGRIGDNIAQYARKFARTRRDLDPPATERIRNFVSELRRAAAP